MTKCASNCEFRLYLGFLLGSNKLNNYLTGMDTAKQLLERSLYFIKLSKGVPMNKFIFSSFIVLAFSFASAEEVVKTCNLKLQKLDNEKLNPTTIEILKDDQKITAKTMQIIDGHAVVHPLEEASILDFSVRENLTSQSSNLNRAEDLILRTSDFLNTPGLENIFSVGLKLTEIRQAKLYQIGKSGNMGAPVIIEARDKVQHLLGSFITGTVPFACER